MALEVGDALESSLRRTPDSARDVTRNAVSQIAQATGLRRDQLYFAATHPIADSAAGERIVGEAFAGPFNPGPHLVLPDASPPPPRMPLPTLTPASLGTGSFDAGRFVRNRLVGDRGRVNPNFNLVSIPNRTATPP